MKRFTNFLINNPVGQIITVVIPVIVFYVEYTKRYLMEFIKQNPLLIGIIITAVVMIVVISILKYNRNRNQRIRNLQKCVNNHSQHIIFMRSVLVNILGKEKFDDFLNEHIKCPLYSENELQGVSGCVTENESPSN